MVQFTLSVFKRGELNRSSTLAAAFSLH